MNQEKRLVSKNAKYRTDCAKWRRDERDALANARRRAQILKEAAAAAEAVANRRQSQAPPK
jgi:hypothetical protein